MLDDLKEFINPNNSWLKTANEKYENMEIKKTKKIFY